MNRISNYVAYKRALKFNYILLFEQQDYSQIIHTLSEKTQRFAIIDDCNLSEGDFDKFIQIDMIEESNLEEKLEQVVSGSITESDQTVRAYYDFGIILTVSMMAEDYARFYEYGFLQEQLPDSYYIKRFEIIENNFICVYSNTKMKRDFAKKEKSELVFLSIGIGDFAAVYDIIVPFLERDEIKYIVINKYYNNTADNIELLLSIFGVHKRIIILDYTCFEYIHDYVVQSGEFGDCYLVNVTEKNFSGKLTTKFMNYYLHYRDYIEKIISPIKVVKKEWDMNHIFQQMYSVISEGEKKYIDQILTSGKKKIGLQFSSNNDEHTNRSRAWNSKEVAAFCKLASSKDYEVINLTPYPKSLYDSTCFTDASNLSMISMIVLISKMDYVVGIDSCCGHIASMVSRPNITIWTLDLPIDCRNQKISWRTVNLNYSLVARNKNVSHEIVWNVLEDIEYKRIILSKDLTIIDSLENHNMAYVD